MSVHTCVDTQTHTDAKPFNLTTLSIENQTIMYSECDPQNVAHLQAVYVNKNIVFIFIQGQIRTHILDKIEMF